MSSLESKKSRGESSVAKEWNKGNTEKARIAHDIEKRFATNKFAKEWKERNEGSARHKAMEKAIPKYLRRDYKKS